jgi:DNA-directed RNA polymerase alpha subunit
LFNNCRAVQAQSFVNPQAGSHAQDQVGPFAARAEGEGKMSGPNKLEPTPELPDDTLINDVEFPARIRNVLAAAGLKTVGEVREISDDTLLSFQDFGKGSVALLRETLGLPSTDGVRPLGKKPT